MKLKYFKLEEFDSPDLIGSGEKMNATFLKMLDEARDIAEISFRITSGYRTKKHNEKVGGVNGSSHTRGLAADIACSTSRNRFIIVNALLLAGFTRIGIAKNFIHVDFDNDKSEDVIFLY